MLPTELLLARYGQFKVLVQPDLISDSIRTYGEWAQTEIDLLGKFIRPGDIVFDVGAFIGTHSRAFSNWVGEAGIVVSFEPQRDVFTVLHENAELAPIKNISAHNIALGAKGGIAKVTTNDATNFGSNSFIRISDLDKQSSTDPDRTTLGTIDQMKPDKLNFIKIDTEGTEIEILQGALNTIRRCKPIIFLEVNQLEAVHELFKFIAPLSYHCFGVVSKSFNPSNFLDCRRNIYFAGAVELGLLLIPEERSSSIRTARDSLLPEMQTVDDLVLLLLHKPQYPSEVLEKSKAAERLQVPNVMSMLEKLDALELLKRENLENQQRLTHQSAVLQDLQERVANDRERLSKIEEELERRRNETLAAKFRKALGRKRQWTPGDVAVLRSDAADSDHVYVEKAYFSGLVLNIEGWYFNDEEEISRASITVANSAGPQELVLRINLERRDVADAHNSKKGLYSGFRGTFDVDPHYGMARSAELKFDFKSHRPSAKYLISVERAPVSKVHVLISSARGTNLRRIKVAARDILRGDVSTLWFRAVRLASDRGQGASHDNRPVDLGQVLSLIDLNSAPGFQLTRSIDIIIPAYNCLQYLDPLFESVSRNTPDHHRIILVDNGNDDPRIVDRLRQFAAERPNVRLLRLEENQGFVGAVNRAVELTENDFVLLNTDVIVPPRWLERLIQPLDADSTVATVTPFSNAATICSFPNFCEDNEIYGGFTVECIDRWFQLVRSEMIDTILPSGVGFCMAMRRSAWIEIGPFDEIAFRKGYGEENDWCLRASQAGYINVIAPNLFAYHKHGGTFESSGRAALRQKSYDEVVRRYPNYPQQVADYIKRDPLRKLRDILAAIVAGRESTNFPVLVIDHQWGGGANIYRKSLVESLSSSGRPVFLQLINSASTHKEASCGYDLHFSFGKTEASFRLTHFDHLNELISIAGIKEIVVNNLVTDNDPLEFVRRLVEIGKSTDVKITVPIHDYYPLCPSYTLLNAKGQFCDLPAESTCAECLKTNLFAENPKQNSIVEWRRAWSELLDLAQEVVCFSDSSRQLVLRAYPSISKKIIVRPHQRKITFARLPRVPKGGSLKIGVVGSIGPQKGARVLGGLAEVMQKLEPGAQIILVGTGHQLSKFSNIKVTGAYDPAQLPDLIEKEGIQLCLFPSIWPETFSFVTQELMEMRMPLAVFDLGAPSERVRTYELGRVLDLELSRNPEQLYYELKRFSKELNDCS